MTTYRSTLLRIMPRWLTQKWGSRLLFGIGVHFDALIELCVQSLLARMPEYAPPDALSAIGRDRQIRRGIEEPDDSYAQRLKDWLYVRQMRGSPFALMRQMCAFMHGYEPDVHLVNNCGAWFRLKPDGDHYVKGHRYVPGSWNYDGHTSNWWRFWLIVNVPPALWQLDAAWGDEGSWGDGGVWGCTATYEQIQSLITIIKDGEPSHASCHGLIFVWQHDFTPPVGWGGFHPPQGDWGAAGKPDGAGNYVLARDPNAAITGRL